MSNTKITKVEKQGDTVYLIGRIVVSNGLVDGKLASWLELSVDQAIDLFLGLAKAIEKKPDGTEDV